jgi:hypothetical protein
MSLGSFRWFKFEPNVKQSQQMGETLSCSMQKWNISKYPVTSLARVEYKQISCHKPYKSGIYINIMSQALQKWNIINKRHVTNFPGV